MSMNLPGVEPAHRLVLRQLGQDLGIVSRLPRKFQGRPDSLRGQLGTRRDEILDVVDFLKGVPDPIDATLFPAVLQVSVKDLEDP